MTTTSAPSLSTCAAEPSSLAPPTTLAGTTWDVQANQETAELIITNQGGPGGPGGPNSLVIIGTIGIAPIRGWYSPASGRIHFLHNNVGSGATVRVFTGNLSDDVASQPRFMGGTVMVEAVAFGHLGEYNFSAIETS